MSPAKVALGWGVLNARERTDPAIGRSRAIVVGADYWMSNGSAAAPGFDGLTGTAFRADSRRTLQAMIKWLCGLDTGANILIMANIPYGTQFQAALTASGHSFTILPPPAGQWEGYEPPDYDVFFAGGSIAINWLYHGLLGAQEKLDYLLSHGSRIVWNGGHQTHWRPYGFGPGPPYVTHPHFLRFPEEPDIHEDNPGPPEWQYQRPFECVRFGNPGAGGSWGTEYWALVMGTTGRVTEETLQRSGAREVYYCALPDTVEDENQFHVYPDTGVIGLYSSDGDMT